MAEFVRGDTKKGMQEREEVKEAAVEMKQVVVAGGGAVLGAGVSTPTRPALLDLRRDTGDEESAPLPTASPLHRKESEQIKRNFFGF